MIEKVIGYFKGLFLLCALVLIPAACSQGAADEPEPVVPEIPNEGNEVLDSDSVMVSFAPTSLEWEVSPMSRASNDDLYAVLVYQSKEERKNMSIVEVHYALALFDDPSLISLKLAKNYYYHFVMAYVPNGKNVIEKKGDGWGTPFTLQYYTDYIPKLNTIVYHQLPNTVGFCEAASQAKGITSTFDEANFFNEILSYRGSYRNFIPETNNQKVPIQLYRWQYGIKIKVTDFHEGSISFMSDYENGKKYSIESNSTGTSTMEYYLEFPSYLIAQSLIGYENAGEYADKHDNIGGRVKIVYTTPIGEEIILWSNMYGRTFPFKRMKMHTLEFSLSDAIINGGISPDLMEAATDPMEEVSWEF